MSGPAKFSFSFKKVVKEPTIAPVSDKVKAEDNFKDETPITEFVHSIDADKIHGDGSIERSKKPSDSSYIIPLIKINKYNIKEPKIEHREAEEKDDKTEIKDELKTEIKEESIEETVPVPKEESLFERAKRELIEEGRGKTDDGSDAWKSMIINKPPEEYENDKKVSFSIRAKESTLEDYSKVPLEAYGAALLRGMGWKDGGAIGGINKAIVQPPEGKIRARGLGLGTESALKRHKPGGTEPPSISKPK